MNDWKNKVCSHCLRLGHSLRCHDYTLVLFGNTVQVKDCVFFSCDFCSNQTPSADTVRKLGEAREKYDLYQVHKI